MQLGSFELKNNRSQVIDINGKEIILDAYNANPTSVSNAIESFSNIENSKAIILGDMFELGNNSDNEHKKIVELLSSKNIDSCYFIGEDYFKVKNLQMNHSTSTELRKIFIIVMMKFQSHIF